MATSRRVVIGGLLCAATLGAGTSTQTVKSIPTPMEGTAGLRVHARRKGMSFGSMILSTQLGTPLARTIRAECDTVVPGIEMKWGETEKRRGKPDYTRADQIVAFARKAGMEVRGHAGFWYRNIPSWSRDQLAQPGFADIVTARVSDIVGHFRGQVGEWDVVNEALQPGDGLPWAMRRAPFGVATDPGWIADCFHAAHAADPNARLAYNDYGLDNAVPDDESRRRATLKLLAELKRRNAPVDVMGLQTHIGVGQRFDASVYRRFLADVAAMGIALRITEFDINDRRAPGDPAARDQAVADRALELLEVAFAEPAMQGMITWGLDDADSQFVAQPAMARADGLSQRPLPLDSSLRRKPLWQAIAQAYDGAPTR